MNQTLQFTASLGMGLFLGLLNWVLWVRWTKDLLKREKLNWGFFAARSLVKLGVFALLIWLLLSKKVVEPIGFLIGFSCIVVFLIVKGAKWN